MLPRDILQQVRRIHIRTSRLVDDVLAGAYHSTFKGRGMEFDEVREYMPGDEVRTIDWHVTARRGQPYVKRYVEERELTVMLLVDLSASGQFGSVLRLKTEIATELCAVLAWSAIRNHDKVGLILFTDHIEKIFPNADGPAPCPTRHAGSVIFSAAGATNGGGPGSRISPYHQSASDGEFFSLRLPGLGLRDPSAHRPPAS